MNKNNDGFFSRKWVLRLTALVLAIFLFVYVNGSKNGFLRQNTRDSNRNSALMSNKSATIEMPLNITVDNAKYVVTGYPQTVKVRVNGPSALVTTTNNIQNFRAYLDLSKLAPGTHRVKVKTSGLNSELRATTKPQYINVNIQPRRTISMRVSVRLNSRTLDNGYTIGRPRLDTDVVQVTGSREEVDRVSRVVAFVAIPSDAKNDLQRQVTLQALDKNGQTLNVVITPKTTNVTIPISRSSDSSSSSSSEDSSSSSSSRSQDSNDITNSTTKESSTSSTNN
ncbi:CdaR family protein [Limosilactobacillus avium]|uniref:CdaR family protein n=1 Tax=Limosilactobacillus avium TaxID=2991831 RepID=UPI0024B99835|nr:CdaR family protein [Limosilactobacillus avium]